MGFFDRIFGGSKKKTSTTTTGTSTTTPNNPVWVSQGLEGLGNKIMGLSALDPKSFVAGPSSLQTKAFENAANLTSSPYFGQAGDIFGNVAKAGANTYDATTGEAVGYDPVTGEAQGYTASSLLEGLDRYMSPYTNDVVNSALADYDYGAGATRANQSLEEARSGAFGGSGAAIGRSLTEGELARGRAATSAQLRDQAFTRGAGLSATDAGFRNQAAQFNAGEANRFGLANMDARNSAAAARAAAQNQFGLANMNAKNDASRFNASAADTALARQLQAGGALADLGTTMGNDARANVSVQAQAGADQRAIEQALASAPLEVLQRIAQMYGGMPLNLLSGSTTTGSGTSNSTTKEFDPWMKNVGTAGQAIGTFISAFSDRRLKTDIEKIGEREDGLGVYSFRYLWSPARFIGVMAQEVLKVKPEAVIHTPSGYMAVNYGAL